MRVSPVSSFLASALSSLAIAACCATAPTPVAVDPAAEAPETPIEHRAEPVTAAPLSPVEAAVAAPDRSEADRALDAGRKPVELLTLLGVKPGQHVAEIAAGGGYTSELLARIVGPSGSVIGQNPPFVLERFAEKPWSERLQKPVMAPVKRWDGGLDTPLPPDAKDLDLVVNHLFYHDTVWLGADRMVMNRAIFAALKPGGRYAIIDHSAAAGHGIADVQTIHRIEESTVEAEVVAAGFVLAQRSDLLRHPADTRDWNASPMSAAEKRGTSDRFILVFTRP